MGNNNKIRSDFEVRHDAVETMLAYASFGVWGGTVPCRLTGSRLK
jgi:hypothetical protein